AAATRAGRGEPGHNCNKFYHAELGVILRVADRAAARASAPLLLPRRRTRREDPRMPRNSLAVVSTVLMLASTGAAAGAASAASAGSATIAGPALSINISAGRHAINRDIYGMNFAPARLESQLKLPVVRWGGNATTRYNYLLDTANHASDWYFENIPNTVKNPATLPGESTADRFIGQNKRDSADSIITVPLIRWTPKSRAQTCGFSVA